MSPEIVIVELPDWYEWVKTTDGMYFINPQYIESWRNESKQIDLE